MPVYQKDMPELTAHARSLSDLILGNKYKQEQAEQQKALAVQQAQEMVPIKVQQERELLPVEQQRAMNQSDIDHANLVRSVKLARETAAAQGMQPGKFSLNAGQNSIGINPEAVAAGQNPAIEKAKKLANITGYDIANPDAVIPSQRDAEETKAATAGYKSMEKIAAELDKQLADRNMLDMLGVYRVPLIGDIGTSKAKSIDANVGRMLMTGKNQEKLGALQAPEIALMERMQGGVGGIGAALSGSDSTRDRLQEFLSGAKTSTEQSAMARGYKPQPGYLGQEQASSADPEADAKKAARLKRIAELKAKLGK